LPLVFIQVSTLSFLGVINLYKSLDKGINPMVSHPRQQFVVYVGRKLFQVIQVATRGYLCCKINLMFIILLVYPARNWNNLIIRCIFSISFAPYFLFNYINRNVTLDEWGHTRKDGIRNEVIRDKLWITLSIGKW
jgi:hypothetical protein